LLVLTFEEKIMRVIVLTCCVLSALLVGACGSDDSNGGSGATGGSSGSGGSGGSGATAGSAGSGASGGSAGSGATGGSAGSGASAGASGAGGSAGGGGGDANAACEAWLASVPQGAAAPIIHYEYGNQITGSRLSIFADGSVEHSERSSAGSDWQPVSEAPLNAAEIDQLKAEVQAVAGGSWSTLEGLPFALGAKTGSLCAVHVGQGYTVRAIEMTGAGDPMLDHQSTATEASSIVTRVHAYTAEDMP
jgi:hypothetical protein